MSDLPLEAVPWPKAPSPEPVDALLDGEDRPLAPLPRWGSVPREEYEVVFARRLAELAGDPPEIEARPGDPEPLGAAGTRAALVDFGRRQDPQIHSAGTPVEAAESIEPAADIHSAGSSTSSAAERIRARFATAAAFVEAVPERPPYLAERYLVRGATTECVGKVKVGKTDLTLALVRSLLTGERFLGGRTERTAVVYLTEQPPSSLRASLARAGLVEATDLLILSWAAVAGERWPMIAEAAVLEARRIGAGALFVDTLSRFAGIRGDGENSAGEADAAMAPLQVAAADGLAVWVNRHERKAGGEIGDSGRGSSAFSGAVDIALALRRGEGNTRPTVRVLHALSRFNETPDTLVIERTDAGYVALGDELAVARAEARRAALDSLPSEPSLAVRFEDLHALLDGRHGRTTLQEALGDLIDSGDVVRSGAGRKGDPYRYHAPPAEAPIHSAAPIREEAAESIWPVGEAPPDIPIEDDYPPSARALDGASERDLMSVWYADPEGQA